MKKELTAWQRTALAHPHDVDVADEPDPKCMHVGPKDRTVMLSCDIDAETARTFGGPVWHVSVWPRSRTRAEAVLSGVGEGELFEEPGIHPQILHLRQRMTTEEIKLLGSSAENQVDEARAEIMDVNAAKSALVRAMARSNTRSRFVS